MFECPFDFDHFSKSIDSNIARDREIDYNCRNKQLLYFLGLGAYTLALTVRKLVTQAPVIHSVLKLNLIFRPLTFLNYNNYIYTSYNTTIPFSYSSITVRMSSSTQSVVPILALLARPTTTMTALATKPSLRTPQV